MKALFTDFYGTLVKEDSPTSVGVAMRIYKNGNGNSFEDVVSFWWSEYRKRTAEACGEDWRSQHDLALETIRSVLEHFDCSEDAVELRDTMNEHWSNPILYDDTRRFLNELKDMGIPVYFVTNSDDIFIIDSMNKHGLSCDDLITSERAKYSKPRPEIFQYALDALGLSADEVVHLGDSLGSDIVCASSLGIKAIWLNREGAKVPDDMLAAADLDEALELIKKLRD